MTIVCRYFEKQELDSTAENVNRNVYTKKHEKPLDVQDIIKEVGFRYNFTLKRCIPIFA